MAIREFIKDPKRYIGETPRMARLARLRAMLDETPRCAFNSGPQDTGALNRILGTATCVSPSDDDMALIEKRIEDFENKGTPMLHKFEKPGR